MSIQLRNLSTLRHVSTAPSAQAFPPKAQLHKLSPASWGPTLSVSFLIRTFLHLLQHQSCSSCNHREIRFKEDMWRKPTFTSLNWSFSGTTPWAQAMAATLKQPSTSSIHLIGVWLRWQGMTNRGRMNSSVMIPLFYLVRHHLFPLVHRMNLGDWKSGCTWHPSTKYPNKTSAVSCTRPVFWPFTS